MLLLYSLADLIWVFIINLSIFLGEIRGYRSIFYLIFSPSFPQLPSLLFFTISHLNLFNFNTSKGRGRWVAKGKHWCCHRWLRLDIYHWWVRMLQAPLQSHVEISYVSGSICSNVVWCDISFRDNSLGYLFVGLYKYWMLKVRRWKKIKKKRKIISIGIGWGKRKGERGAIIKNDDGRRWSWKRRK